MIKYSISQVIVLFLGVLFNNEYLLIKIKYCDSIDFSFV